MKRVLAIAAAAAILIAGLFALRRALAEEPLDRLRAVGEGIWEGSWHFPRGGPYILGFESPREAKLFVDGRLVARGAGQQDGRSVFAPGVYAVRFVGPAQARLLWHPPGRRGALEYVPASSLSPAPPHEARFGAGAGTSRLDGAIALAMLAVVFGAALAIVRPRLRDRRTAIVGVVVFAFAFAVRLVGLSSAGQTWDEDEYWSAGRNYLINLLSLDFRPSAWRWNHEHPPVTKYVAGLGALWADGYGVSRALFALVGAGTSAAAFFVGRRLFGTRAAVLGAIAVALSPRLVAHDRIVGHEAPSVFLWTLGVLLALRTAEADARALPRRLAGVGVVLGLAMATRFSNLLLAPLVAAVMLLSAPRGQRVRTAALGLVVVPAVAVATFVLLWPRMWTAPLEHLQAAWSVLRSQHLPEWYLGRLVQVPTWHYFPVYFLVTAPAGLLAAALVGAARGTLRRESGMLVAAAWILVPFAIGFSPVKQDGVRYVLPALVPLALLSGAGVDWAIGALAAPAARVVTAGAFVLYLLFVNARIHPYPLDYYGEHVGGPKTVYERRWFETGWWGEGIDAGVRWINAHAHENARLALVIQPIHLNWLRHDLWRHVMPKDADYILVNELGRIAYPIIFRGEKFVVPEGARLVHRVKAQGATLLEIWRRETPR